MMGASDGSHCFSDSPGGMRCLRASASVAIGIGADLFSLGEEGGVKKVWSGVEDDWWCRRGGAS